MMRRDSLTLLLLVIIVPVFLLTAGSGRAGDVDSIKNFRLRATIEIPLADKTVNPLQVFRFFDISWVDEPTERYFIADRSNAGVDIIDAETNTWVHRIGGVSGQKITPTRPPDHPPPRPSGGPVAHTGNQPWGGGCGSTREGVRPHPHSAPAG